MTQTAPIHGWLRLFRPPNLLTVPGDVIMGYALAAQAVVFPWSPLYKAIAASLCFYMAGLALNDYADRAEDAYDRPDRPVPSGVVSPGAARAAGLFLLASGLGCCYALGTPALWLGVSLTVSIWVYTFYLKSVPGAGALVMGLCRAQNVALGALALPILHPMRPAVWIAALLMLVYIFTVTALARREAQPHYPGAEVWLPYGALLLGFICFMPVMPESYHARAAFVAVYSLAGGCALWFGIRMQGFAMTPNLPAALARKEQIVDELPRRIGQLIAVLLLIQSAFVLAALDGATGYLLAGLLLAAYPVNRLAARHFYAS